MTTTGPSLTDISGPSRVAEPGEGVGLDELELAARNHGMPLELMRHDVTPLGAHYLLTHFDMPHVDVATWRLEIGGLVRSPLSLSLADLQARPHVTRAVTLECAGNGRARLTPRPVSQPWLHEAVGTMTWTGTPLAPLLHEAGLLEEAVDVVFTGADHGVEKGEEQDYARSLSVGDARREDVLLAWACNGVDLPPQHGYPLRLLVPGWYGMASVKWLTRVEAVAERFAGPQMRHYRLRRTPDEPGTPLTRIFPRALMVPPGFPDFMTRRRALRLADGNPLRLEGRAWSGWAPISRVEVSVDDGASWQEAVVEPAVDATAWHRWTFDWVVPGPGSYALLVRAADESGRAQRTEDPWNRGGFANGTPQRVELTVIP